MILVEEADGYYLRGTPSVIETIQINFTTRVTNATINVAVKGVQVISSLSVVDHAKNSGPFSIAAPGCTSNLPVTLSIASGPATISGTPGGTYTVTLTGSVGTVVLAADQAGNDSYLAADEITTSFQVTKIPQTIDSFSSIGSKLTSATPFSISPPTASSGLTVAVTVKSGPATINGNTVTLTGAEGPVVLAANQSGNSDYYSAAEVTTFFTVAKASQTISSFFSIVSKLPSAYPFSITPPAASSGLTVAVTVKIGPATISGNTVTLTGEEGTVVLAANQSGNANYNAAPEVITSFTVAKISQSISAFQAIPSYVPSSAPATITITPPTASSGLSVAVTVKSGPATISGNTVTLTGAEGTVVLAANQSGNADYNAAREVTTLFSVFRIWVGLWIDRTKLYHTYTGESFPVTVTPALPGFTPTITYNGSTTAPTAAGRYTVLASINDTDHLGAASAVLYINKAPATVTLSGDTSITYDGSGHALVATTTPSGLATSITYNGSTTPPTNSGSYYVVATVTDPNYSGIAKATLRITGMPFFYNNATGDGSLATISNWWKDSAHTVHATALPTESAKVYIDAVFSPPTLTVNFDLLIFGKFSSGVAQDFYHINAGVISSVGKNAEFWNGYRILNSGDSPDPGFSGEMRVHYPCQVPMTNLAPANRISYIGYPFAIAQTASDFPIQQLWIDQASHGTAIWGQQPPNSGQSTWNVTQTSVSPGTLKEGDDFLFQVVFHSGASFLDPQVTGIACSFLDPSSRAVVLSTTEFLPCIVTGWGNPAFFSYLFYLPIAGNALSECFGSFADGVNETVTLSGEIEWQEVNQTGVGPSLITRRSQNFPVTITRSLNQGADFNS